jgi:ketosteroid isomerase-like protein
MPTGYGAILGAVTDLDLDSLRAVFDLHNIAGMDFPDALREHLRPDAEWVESPLLPGATTHRGREAVVALFRERFEAGQMELTDLTLTQLSDERALAAFTIRIVGAKSGAEGSMRAWNLITVEDGLIARIEEFTDEASALAAAR